MSIESVRALLARWLPNAHQAIGLGGLAILIFYFVDETNKCVCIEYPVIGLGLVIAYVVGIFILNRKPKG